MFDEAPIDKTERGYCPPLNHEFFKRAKARRKEEERQARIVEEEALAQAKRRAKAEAKARMEDEICRRDAEPEALRAVEKYRIISVRQAESDERPPLDHRLPAAEIVRLVAKAHGVTAEEVLGDRRQKPISMARREAIKAVADARPDWSLIRLGHFFKKDHTTILYALRKMKAGTQEAA